MVQLMFSRQNLIWGAVGRTSLPPDHAEVHAAASLMLDAD
jgi:hypothetical protein